MAIVVTRARALILFLGGTWCRFGCGGRTGSWAVDLREVKSDIRAANLWEFAGTYVREAGRFWYIYVDIGAGYIGYIDKYRWTGWLLRFHRACWAYGSTFIILPTAAIQSHPVICAIGHCSCCQ
jgi:hypothetical protein